MASRSVSYPMVLAVLLACSTSMRPAASQGQGQPETSSSAIFYVSVTDDSGHPILGLGPADFTISIENTHPSINYFSGRDIPTAIGFVLDVSGSMRNRIKYETLMNGLIRFAELGNPADELFIVAIGARPQLMTDWTPPGAAFAAAVEETGKAHLKGPKALYDACVFAINKIQETKLSKRVLFLISDGQDNGSQLNEAKLRGLVEQSDIMMFSIGVTDPTIDSLSGFGRSILEKLSVVSGGRVFFPGSGQEAVNFLDLVASEIRHRYAIGISLDGLKGDGRWHGLKVEVNPHEAVESAGTQRKKIHLNVLTRKNFFEAPKAITQ